MPGRADTGKIPVFVLTGFLGAGKTTLLNRMMADPALADTALVINEFGEIPVDHDLVRTGRERVAVTTSGCICCTRGSDLRSALDELLILRRAGQIPDFARVIVETTGLADPAPILNSLIPGGLPAQGLRDHVIARSFALSGVITVVDLAGIGAALDTHPESLRQIAFADHAVLTHADEAPVADWPGRLRAINPGLRIHAAAEPGFDPAMLLEPGSYDPAGHGAEVAAWLAAEGPEGPDPLAPARHGAVQSVPLTARVPLRPAALTGFLERLTDPAGSGGRVLRVKGLVALGDDPARPALVHAVGHRLYPIVRLDAWPGVPGETRLIVIGTGLDAAALGRSFAACSAAPGAALRVGGADPAPMADRPGRPAPDLSAPWPPGLSRPGPGRRG